MKPIGSEKLTGMDKVQRIIEIANYGKASKNVTESTTEYAKQAVDGNTYAIVKEKDGYYVKVGLNESSLDYVDGILNKNKNRFDSYSGALKKINLMIKPLNEQFNEGKEDPVLNETKYVLKKPAAPAEEPSMDIPAEEPASDEESFDFSSLDLGTDDSEEPSMDVPTEEPAAEEPAAEEPSSEEPEEDKLKKVQKLTGKLGQALRDMKIDMESSDIKYVLNSIISAVDLTKLNEEDLDGVMENFEELENFEIEGKGEESVEPEMDMDLGDEEFDMDSIEAPEEEMAEELTFSDSLEDEEDYRPMSDRETFSDSLESDLDENAFVNGIAKLGPKFVEFYKNNTAGREAINKIGAKAISKGTDKMASELDKSEKFDKGGKVSDTLKKINPTNDDIDSLGKMIFGDLNEDEVSKKIDNILGKYFE